MFVDMRRRFEIIFLAAQFCLLAAASADNGARVSLPDSDRQIRIVETLTVNASNVSRMVAVNKCEAEGLRDIRSLMVQSRIEELWVFVPAGETAECHWIEIGDEPRAGPDNTTVRVDWTYLEKLMARFELLYLYHFHPLVYFERCSPQPGCNAFSVPVMTGVVPTERLVINLQFAMPSAEDIYFMSESSWRYDRHQPAGGTIRHRVVSPYGVIEYSLSGAGKTRYAENRGSRMEGLYIKLVAANSLADELILGMIENHPLDMAAALRALVASMNSKNLRVTLAPAE